MNNLNEVNPRNSQANPEHQNTEISDKQVVWRRNCPYLYQTLFVSELDWPSLTVDWVSLPHSSNINEDTENAYNLLLGTHSNSEQNYIILAKVRVCNQHLLQQKYERERLAKTETVRKNEEVMPEKIQIQHKIPHDGEPNRVRHNPHQPTRIASRTPLGEIHIFSTAARSKNNKVSPEIILSGHDCEGYAIEWNPNRNWYLIGGSYDGKLSLWDSNKKQQNGNKVTPLINFTFHEKQIEDVSFNKFHASIFGSCDDAGLTALWDSRKCDRNPFKHLKCHEGAQYGVQFSPTSEYNFASCGSDSLVKVWDLRNMSQHLFSISQSGNQEVTQIQWSREDPVTLWSVAANRATLWDMGSQTAKFVHAGHRENIDEQTPNRINELCVNINQPDTVAAVDANNEIHVFQPNKKSKL